ncbi:MAG: hypothetical protein AB7S72_08580 [Draconibacterium sp.]|jgi:hypothetical protein
MAIQFCSFTNIDNPIALPFLSSSNLSTLAVNSVSLLPKTTVLIALPEYSLKTNFARFNNSFHFAVDFAG